MLAYCIGCTDGGHEGIMRSFRERYRRVVPLVRVSPAFQRLAEYIYMLHVPPTLTLLFTVTGLSWSIYYNFAVELH